MSNLNFVLSRVEYVKSSITSGPGFQFPQLCNFSITVESPRWRIRVERDRLPDLEVHFFFQNWYFLF